MRIACSARIAAPAATVFACVDEPDHIVQWVGGAVEHTYLTARAPVSAVGQKFRQRLRQGRSIRVFHGEIIAWEPHEHFALRIPSPAYTSEAFFYIVSTSSDQCVVDYTLEIDLHARAARILGPMLYAPLWFFVRQQIGRLKSHAQVVQARAADTRAVDTQAPHAHEAIRT